MIKKYAVLFLMVAVGLGLMAGAAQAEDWTNDGTHAAYTVNSLISTTPDDLFTRNETPYLYVFIPGYSTAVNSQKAKTTYLSSVWSFTPSDPHGFSTEVTYSATKTVAAGGYYITPTDWLTDPSLHDQVGTWTISDISYQYIKDNSTTVLKEGHYIGTPVKFTVTGTSTTTPEPFSAALFLLGGVALSTRKFFTKKK